MDVLFLLIAISCVLLALVSAFSTLGLSPTAEKIADKVIYGSCAAALMSVLLAALFLWAYEPLRVDQRTIAHSVDPPLPRWPAAVRANANSTSHCLRRALHDRRLTPPGDLQPSLSGS
jgi:hypothetical protein